MTDFKILSPYIEQTFNIAIEHGNTLKEVSYNWSKAKQVLNMNKPLSNEVRETIINNVKMLEYWKESGTPHNAPEEGFFCNEFQVGLSFPLPPLRKL